MGTAIYERVRVRRRESLNAISEWHRAGQEPRLTAAAVEMSERETDRPKKASCITRMQNIFNC